MSSPEELQGVWLAHVTWGGVAGQHLGGGTYDRYKYSCHQAMGPLHHTIDLGRGRCSVRVQ